MTDTRERLLIVDDEEIARANLERVMQRDGHAVTTAAGGAQALALIETQGFDLVLTDLRMEGVDGMQVLRRCRQRLPEAEVIVITGYATIDSSVAAIKEGAFYYIAKPYRLAEVRKVVSEALEKVRLRRENRQLKRQLEGLTEQARIITQDPAMHRLLGLARQVAPSDCSVLIEGASGTGKELFARYLHHHSGRRDGPYLAVNCGALTAELLANELFGHERAAYTGAGGARKGLIETAAGGTLFLDEVTEMPPEMQVKLLRVIQEREVLRVGATQPIAVDIRILAATNRDLDEAVASGRLRQDLYYRLNVVTLRVPPLAQRRDDIPLLVAHFLEKYAARMRKSVTAVAPTALAILTRYAFPGNVRELENIIQRGVALAEGDRIAPEHLPEALREQPMAPAPNADGALPTLQEQERRYIHWVMEQVGGNQTLAARTLGINRSSLWRKLRGYAQGSEI
ncbi:sigma-54 dependent transcriptional regulator [uncultured Thiodictyon sp.]|uniref:sigma-54-dependent transcriptional regulator n=1 Tax=uncultured Thiodictyon sp. TaxID=1846217 RepID=UPI0025D318B5|nr:sigma-54 dependent transcriptional regulator [uncultured Thiodictyon sp.]